jgi:uncharacterized protein with ParB-like and HNH nuclease domain
MKTEKIIVSDLFEKPRRYLIPLFQRGYVWTKDGQWAPLWEDLLSLVKALSAQKASNARHLRKHFLGAIVLQQQNLGIRYIPVSDVIDGQQRIITLQLLLLAFRDSVVNLENRFLNETLNRLTRNPGPHVDNTECFKVWPTSVYREDFKSLAQAGSASTVKKHFSPVYYRRKLLPRPQLVEAYLFFCDQIEQYLSNTTNQADNTAEQNQLSDSIDSRVQLAENLLEAIIRNVQLVEINLDAEDDPQIIFETLNARGVELSPSDLIRNFIFLYATRQQENVVDLYEKYWKPFDETPDNGYRSKTKRFWKEEERQGRYKTNRLDLFFYHYLIYRTESDLKLGHIFQEFKDWWDGSKEPRSARNELTDLATAAEIYHRLIRPTKNSRLGKFAFTLRTMDTTTVYPVIFFLEFRRSELGDAEIDGIYDDLESYLVRRAVCDLTPKNYNRVFLSLMKYLQGQEKPTRATVQHYLLSLEGESVMWPDDNNFKQHFVSDPLYTRLRSARVQMILEALEQSLATSFQESFTLDTYISIEHVWPQNPEPSAWPSLPTNEDGSANWPAILRRQNLINSVGNLTLVTPSFNSSLRNHSFTIKCPTIAKESRLRLNTYFHDLNPDTWTEEDIIKRGEKLFIHAQRIWARPQVNAA